MKALSLLLLILCGCASTRYIPYSGAQQDWPTAPGSFMESAAVPIYHGLPPRPYVYLGLITIQERTALTRSSAAARRAAEIAKSKRADALLVLEEGERPVGLSSTSFGSATAIGNGAVGSGFGFSSVAYGGNARCIAIKFKSRSSPATPAPSASLEELIRALAWCDANPEGGVMVFNGGRERLTPAEVGQRRAQILKEMDWHLRK